MTRYRKTIAAVVALALAIAADGLIDPTWVERAVQILGVFGIYVVPNKEN